MTNAEAGPGVAIVARVGARLVALMLPHVVETMPPLPVEPIANAPPFVLGISIVRGSPVPVIGGAELLEIVSSAGAQRFISLRIGARRAVFAVDQVLGLRTIDEASMGEIPPLLQAASAETVTALGVLDAQLLLVLQTARLVPESIWSVLEAAKSPS